MEGAKTEATWRWTIAGPHTPMLLKPTARTEKILCEVGPLVEGTHGGALAGQFARLPRETPLGGSCFQRFDIVNYMYYICATDDD